MKNETELVLELCKLRSIDADKIRSMIRLNPDWPYVLGQLLYNRMGGVAYRILRDSNLLGKLNREFRTTLETVYQANIEKTMSMRIVVDDLNRKLLSHNISYAFLKGSQLCYVYPVGCRVSNDIDILIDSKSIEAVTAVLVDNEYEQGYLKCGVFTKASRNEIISSRMLRGETVPFVKHIGFPGMEFSEIDINFSLDYKNDNKSAVQRILRRSTDCEHGIYTVKTLDKYDFVLHLCSHLYKEATVYPWVKMGRDLSLYKFLDIYMLIWNWNKEDFDRLLRRIDEFELYNECYYSFVYVKALFDMDDSGAIYNFIKKLSFDVDSENVMNIVISPEDGRKFAYTNNDLVKRLFDVKRANKLEEIK